MFFKASFISFKALSNFALPPLLPVLPSPPLLLSSFGFSISPEPIGLLSSTLSFTQTPLYVASLS
ncbi:hypothetical protein ACT7DD_15365 [Bacillus paranthracis]